MRVGRDLKTPGDNKQTERGQTLFLDIPSLGFALGSYGTQNFCYLRGFIFMLILSLTIRIT